jgi:hypothetical protein
MDGSASSSVSAPPSALEAEATTAKDCCLAPSSMAAALPPHELLSRICIWLGFERRARGREEQHDMLRAAPVSLHVSPMGRPMAAARVLGRGERGRERREEGSGWLLGPTLPPLHSHRGAQHDRRTPYPAAKSRSPRPSSQQSSEGNETWKDDFAPCHSAKTQG